MSVPELHYTAGWKYQVHQSFKIKLRYNFRIKEDFKSRYYSVTKEGELTVHPGCCWDGPTWFPDVKWMMRPSLIHDILHWLIAKGVIHERYNDLIDKELGYWILQDDRASKWHTIFKLRAGYVRWATGFVDQKKGQIKKVYIV